MSFLSEVAVYVGRVREFRRNDWMVYFAWVGLLVSLFLIVIARPAAVHLSLAFSSMPYREQTLMAWAGLRGSVPIILATFPLLAGVKQADTIFHLVFFITLTSVLLQGTTIAWATRVLKIEAVPSDPSHRPSKD